MYQSSPQVVIRLHPQSLPMVIYPRPLPHVFLSMLPPYPSPWRPSTSTYSLLPVSTIMRQRLDHAPLLAPKTEGLQFVTNPAPPHSPHPSGSYALWGESGWRFYYLAGGHLGFEQPPELTALSCLFRLGDGCCCFWSPCRGDAFSEISESQGRPIHLLPCR
jgi:hypothetical protein